LHITSYQYGLFVKRQLLFPEGKRIFERYDREIYLRGVFKGNIYPGIMGID